MPNCNSKPSAVRASGGGHHAGVVDEHIEVAGPVGDELADRAEVGEVELADLDVAADRRRGLLALRRVTDGEHDARTGPRQLPRGDGADAADCAGDDGGASGLIGDSAVQGGRSHASNVVAVNKVSCQHLLLRYPASVTATARPYHHGNLRSPRCSTGPRRCCATAGADEPLAA